MATNRHPTKRRRSAISPAAARIAGYWGIIGFALLLSQSIFRMFLSVSRFLAHPLSSGQIAVVSSSVLLFTVGKGYFALQRSFAPRFAGRVVQLVEGPTSRLHAVLAPLFCLGLIGGDRKTRIRSYVIVIAIVFLVLGARQLPDVLRVAGVSGAAVALVWGLVATVSLSYAILRPEPRQPRPEDG